MYRTCEGLLGAEVGGKGLVVDGLAHATVLLIHFLGWNSCPEGVGEVASCVEVESCLSRSPHHQL